ncbi:MAG: shikimate dehydrogenase [Gemmataceae bacterium]
MICVVIGRGQQQVVEQEMREAARRGAGLIEVRLDYWTETPDLSRLLAQKPCPLVATVRRPQDGGLWTGSEEARQVLLRQAIVSGFDYVDLETDIADAIPRYRNVRRIISYHNLHGVPDDLEALHQRMCQQDADIVKVVVFAHQPADNWRVLRLPRGAPRPTVAFCMGEIGFPSRLLSLRMGAPFTYAAARRERPLAAGIPSLDDLQHVYRVEHLNHQTRVFGVVGDPIGHSLSPIAHNAAYRHLGLNCLYVPFRVPRGELPRFVTEAEEWDIGGYSVTLPHKEAAATLAPHQEPSVRRTGSANTLARRAEGWWAYNTDYQAIVDSLREGLLAGESLAGRPVLVLGAGGVARTLAFALHDQGARVTIANRTRRRAEQLAAEVGCSFVEWEARHAVPCDLLANGTSVGMHPHVDECPIHVGFLRPELMVFETIYTPETTLLVKEARARGGQVLTGVDMFVRQAGLQFELFTGHPPPLDVMRQAVRRALSPVRE